MDILLISCYPYLDLEMEQPRFFYGYIIVVAAFFIMVLGFGVYYIFGVFFEPLLTEFGWTRAMTSGAYSLCILLSGFLSIVMGGLTDRFGPRLVMTGCGFFLGLGFLLMSQITTIWQIYLFYGVIVAIGLGGIMVVPVSTVARWFVKRRGMMTGITFAGAGLGGMIMAPIARRLISSYDWRSSYAILGIVALVLIIPAVQFLRRESGQIGLSPYGGNEVKAESLGLETRGFSLRQAIHTRQFWLLGAMSLCLLFPLGTMIVHLVIYATGLGISAVSAANILAIMVGISIPARIIIGSAGDRIGNRLAFIICFILMSIASFWLQLAKGEWMLYLFAIIFGFGIGGLFTLFPAMIAELFGLSSHGVIYGIIIFVGHIGEAIGPVLAGHIFDITSSYQLAFLICALVSVIGLIMALLLRPISSEGGTNDLRGSTQLY